MATIHGNDGSVDVGGTTVAEVVSWDMTIEQAVADDTAMGDTWTTHLLGKKAASGTITCHFDPDDTSGQEALGAGSSVTLKLYSEGATTGDDEYSMTATIVSEGITVQHDSVAQRTFGFQANGAVTEGTA